MLLHNLKYATAIRTKLGKEVKGFYMSEANYFEVWVDQRLTWNMHIQQALRQMQKVVREKLKITLWLYTRVMRPMRPTEKWYGGQRCSRWRWPGRWVGCRDWLASVPRKQWDRASPWLEVILSPISKSHGTNNQLMNNQN